MKSKNPHELDDNTLAKLTSKKAEERIEAELKIAELGDNAVPALLAALEREAQTYKRSRRFYSGLSAIMGTVFALYIIVGLAKGFLHGNWEAFSDWSNMFLLFGVTGGTAGLVTQSHKNAVIKLVEFDDIRIVGPLFEAREKNESTLRYASEAALIRLLPHLKASDRHLLNTEQMACVNSALKSKNSEFVVAVLKALEQIGDDTHLETVERLATQEAKNPFDEKVRDCAIVCLPYLRQRAENAVMAKILLRASAPDASPEMLLRPAAFIPDENPNELLRPENAVPVTAPTLSVVTQASPENQSVQNLLE